MAEEMAVPLPAKRLKLENDPSESSVCIATEHGSTQKVTGKIPTKGETVLEVTSEGNESKSNSFAAENCGTNVIVGAQSKDESDAPASGNSSAPSRQVTEEDVGILEYIGTHKGFHGVLKQRYVDFVVKERDLKGRLVELTCTDLPSESHTEPNEHKTDQEYSDKARLPEQVLTDEQMKEVRKVAESDDKGVSFTLDLADKDSKEHRTHVHQSIKSNFPMLDSETVTTDANKKAIRVFKYRGNRGNRKMSGQSWSHGSYCVFVLYKENKDTMDAINLLAKLLRLNTKSFAYAGTKDRRAVTVQQVSTYKVTAVKLQALNKTLKNLCLGDFRYAKEPLRLGDLSGNHFIITLRNVTGTDEEIAAAMSSLEHDGFINYYGLQRFGSTSIPTHHIGRAILSSSWAEVVDLILWPRSDDPKDLAVARQYWAKTKDPRGTLSKIPRQKCMESKLLQGLIRCCTGSRNDFVGALQALPRNMRLMYVHAYQSYVWNSVVSRRIKEYGLKPVVGDLVPVTRSSPVENEALVANSETEVEDDTDEAEIVKPSRIKVRQLTEEDLDSSTQYSIYDVVMPLPGYDVMYPGNSMKDWYRELMDKDGLDVDNMRHKVKDYSLSGAYRNVLMKPQHLQWRVLKYNDVCAPLVLTDLDRIQGKVLDPGPLTDGKLRALQMEFTLPPSCYATMALREVLKCSTSSQYQSSLNSSGDLGRQ